MRIIFLLSLLFITAQVTAQKTIPGEISGDETSNPSGYQADKYELNIEKERLLEVWVSSSAFDSYLMIETPSGDVLSNDDYDDSDSYLRIMASPGKYTIWAGAYEGQNTGAYELKYAKGDELKVKRISGRLDNTDEQLPKGEFIDEYEESINIAGAFDVRLKTLGFSGYLAVTSPSGKTYRSEDYSSEGDYLIVKDLSPEKGKWTIQVTTYYQGETGAYDIEVIDYGKPKGSSDNSVIQLD